MLSGSRQIAGSHEEFVDSSSSPTPFIDCPDNEGLTAPAVTRREDLGNICRELPVEGLVVRTVVAFDLEQVLNVMFGAQESHRQ